MTDATLTLGKGVKKSIKNCGKDVEQFTRSIGECVDVDEFVKSFHHAVRTETESQRNAKIIHQPIDWSKYPASAFRRHSEPLESIKEVYEYDSQEESNEEVDNKKMNACRNNGNSSQAIGKQEENSSCKQTRRSKKRRLRQHDRCLSFEKDIGEPNMVPIDSRSRTQQPGLRRYPNERKSFKIASQIKGHYR